MLYDRLTIRVPFQTEEDAVKPFEFDPAVFDSHLPKGGAIYKDLIQYYFHSDYCIVTCPVSYPDGPAPNSDSAQVTY